MCPAAKYGFSRRGDVGIAPYAKTGGRTRIAGVGDGVPDVPSARQRRAVIPSQ